MTSTKETRFFKEPTHDEIALSAFLAWERDGRPQSSDLNYWLQAESFLRTQRLKLAEVAAAKAAKPWPPQSRVKAVKAAASVKAKPAAPAPKTAAPVAKAAKKAPLATAARATTVKVARTTKTAAHPASIPARATSVRAAR